jgi:hypothetical protein
MAITSFYARDMDLDWEVTVCNIANITIDKRLLRY